MPQITYQVAASDDDAYQEISSCFKSTSIVYFGYLGHSGHYYTGGFRFQNVMLDGGSHEIVSAVLRVKAKTECDDWVQARVYGHDTDNAGDFTSDCSDMDTSRTRTTACSDLILHIDVDADEWYDLPDITDVIQEIIDRGGWSPGNALVLIIWGNIASGAKGNCHSYDSGPSYAAKLVVTYRYKGFAGVAI